MRLGLVTPRYGTEVIGGTEHWLRLLCEHLVALKGWDVEVFTTGALSPDTWADELEAGDSVLNGVTVHRHRSRSGRHPRYRQLDGVMAAHPELVPDDLARHYIDLVGPVCPEVINQAAASSCDLVAVTPYLFWPAVHATARLGRRVIFHGAAHDEPELHLRLMGDVYASVGGFAFNSYSERALVERTFQVGHLPGSVIGNAVVVGPGDPASARAALGLGVDEPFVLCLGRVERSKGTHAAADMWRLYCRRRPGAPRLVVMGPVHDAIEGDEHVIVCGAQSDEVKWGALRACQLLVAPSAWESFSLVVLEAWLAGAPVVVNQRCEATLEHCRRSAGGVWFTDYAEFEAVIDRLRADDALRARLAANGAAYAQRQFDWPVIVERYDELARRILSRVPAA